MRRPASGEGRINVATIGLPRNGRRRTGRSVPLCKPARRRHSVEQQADGRGIEMAFSLIDDTPGATPVAVLSKDRLPAWLAEAPERERNWLTATGFSAEQGKLALVPGETGRLARVIVGLGGAVDEGAAMWALAGGAPRAETPPTPQAAGRAAAQPPCLVDIVWGEPTAPRVTLVGKGVCFDTGGLDLKTASGMRLMKKDMAGAAIVLGLAQAIMDANLE